MFPTEYSWLDTYIDNDHLWLDSALNWEEAFDLILADFTIYNLLIIPFFVNSHFFLDSIIKISFLDVLFITETNKTTFSKELYDLFIWDLVTNVYIKFLPIHFLFYTDYQDFTIILLYYSPELVLALTDYLNIYWINSISSFTPSIVFDLFSDSISSSVSEFTENLFLFILFAWTVVIFINVLNLLKSHAYVDHTDEINSVFALIPIVVFVHNHGKDNINQDRINKIVKWFYYSQIRQRYVSQSPQKLDKDLKIIVSKEAPFDELVNNISMERHLKITPDEFIGVGIRHALYSLMRWYFKSQEAICLTTGVKLRQNMGKKYSLEWDHIFPFSLLKDRGYNFNNKYKYSLAQEITNRAVLTQIGNRKKGANLTEEYFKQVEEKFPKALKLQVIPDSKELWKLENFELFLEQRRKDLADHLNSFLDNLTNIEESKTETSIDELISEGESDELELKSSLRWDYKNEKEEKKLENVILKTISAFANSSGGKLIIGVSDDGEILGLNYDYNSLKGNKDKFELHLKNLINKNFGKNFGAQGLNIKFEEVADNDICLIDVKKWDKPLYLEIYDEKLNQKLKKFYIRSGNSSQELGVDEITEYINNRG